MTHPRLHDTILALYRGCRDRAASEFKEWAMETVRGAVEFDSGIWVTSDIVSDDFSSVYLFQQTPEMMKNYDRTLRLSGDFLAQAVMSNPGRTIRMEDLIPRAVFVGHPAYLQHCRYYGMEHALCTCQISPVTRVTTFVSFYRSDPKAHFVESSRQTKELLVPHMIEAMRINLFSQLHNSLDQGSSALAICDSAGAIYETTPRFPEIMQEVWPAWNGPRLSLPFDTLEGEETIRWARDGLKFEATPCRDLYLLSVAREHVLDRLSRRQLEVAEMLVKGKRYKDISRELGISPSTVTNHVNQIHSRLEISGREDLIRLFDRGRNA
ncbi:helix-turn-helix transcriptional regulator [Sulfuritalea sp.]|uniref:helix-turn-helix transcriptional regulator n=1 Tax=Sulfuritalea sp. TaxID=2480090 RepID=UPI00286D7CBD|nr:helix-turn-helix transcriptional regulator [Sulfuritalea sp.]